MQSLVNLALCHKCNICVFSNSQTSPQIQITKGTSEMFSDCWCTPQVVYSGSRHNLWHTHTHRHTHTVWSSVFIKTIWEPRTHDSLLMTGTKNENFPQLHAAEEHSPLSRVMNRVCVTSNRENSSQSTRKHSGKMKYAKLICLTHCCTLMCTVTGFRGHIQWLWKVLK